jgi:serine protease Do
MVSNASVRLPDNDNPDKMIGPFIQHTAEVDGGNSGGPLLVQTQGVPTGFAVVGINTLKARGRQAANYAIPVARIQSFLDASLKKEPVDERALLDTRLDSFVEGMKANKAVYPHIATYLSNTCVGENAEFALSQLFSKGSRTAQEDILNSFGRPVEGMRQAVAWYIENQTRSKSGSLNIATESVTANDTGYTVTFKINDKMINSEWVNEYGIWRIQKFGDFASGDKELREKNAKAAAKAKAVERALRTDPGIQISADFMYLLERESPALGLDFVARSKYMGFGVRGCFGEDFGQGVMFVGSYIPIKLGASAALTPFGNVGVGMQYKGTGTVDAWGDDKGVFVGVSLQLGLQFITAAVPGLYLHGGYQFNYFELFDTVDKKPSVTDQHAIFVGIGYSF